jgi:hypothetical protein
MKRIYTTFGGIQSQPRAARGRRVAQFIYEDVPLELRDLGGLGMQGLARTLSGSEVDCTATPDDEVCKAFYAQTDIEMPGMDMRRPKATVTPGSRITVPVKPLRSASAGVSGSKKTLIAVAASAAILGAVYLMTRKR